MVCLPKTIIQVNEFCIIGDHSSPPSCEIENPDFSSGSKMWILWVFLGIFSFFALYGLIYLGTRHFQTLKNQMVQLVVGILALTSALIVALAQPRNQTSDLESGNREPEMLRNPQQC